MATVAAPSQELPDAPSEPSQPSSELESDANVQLAIRFLQDPRVQRSPIESQIQFLKSKGVSHAQIQHAFAKIGRTVTAEKIASVRAPAAHVARASPRSTGGAPLPYPQKLTQHDTRSPTMAGPPYTQKLFPYSPPPPQEDTEAKMVDWRDVVIGTGAAVLAGFTGYKLFNRYSPYELRRKSEKKPRHHRGASPRLRRGGHEMTDTDTDPLSTPPCSRVPPLPPPPQLPAKATADSALATHDTASPQEQIQKMQMELNETKEALANERKKCADLAMNSAKARADKQQLSRANDRLTQQLDALKKDFEKLEAKEAGAGDKTIHAAEEVAPSPVSTYFPSVTAEGEKERQSPAAVPLAATPTVAVSAEPPLSGLPSVESPSAAVTATTSDQPADALVSPLAEAPEIGATSTTSEPPHSSPAAAPPSMIAPSEPENVAGTSLPPSTAQVSLLTATEKGPFSMS